ncbi:RidA family protein [Alteromonas sp. 1_MG-2023]|uniref:RidA family protein n=1 Tax=Alteromonas sp. 1_MG-2023 TaxID=3062669 RepID=UPI0026E3D324|nr:RidA family protein [Alteromonas sp. 1_MG-2023]MDO6476950.1 RidA family protein [Alteromonas sp. 1_MG-2023]
MKKLLVAPLLLSAVLANTGCSEAEATSTPKKTVIRHGLIGSDFPILRASEVPATSTIVFLSGSVPGVSNPDAPEGSREAYGDTEMQTVSVMKRIDENLKSLGLTMGDVIKMQAFLVGDPEMDGKMDFAGFMRGYTQFFGTDEQPNLPSRSALQVAGLANPNYLVEIEVTAVRPE